MKRREELLSSGSDVEVIDAEIKRNKAEYQDLYNCLTPLINLLFWDEQRAILNKFYLEAAPMSEIVSEVMKLPVDSSCLMGIVIQRSLNYQSRVCRTFRK